VQRAGDEVLVLADDGHRGRLAEAFGRPAAR
jgi:hypothetical protein